MRRVIRGSQLVAVALSVVLPSAAQVCGVTYLRGALSCPEGATSAECVRWAAPLTAAMLDRNALNTVALCRANIEDLPTGCASGQVLRAGAGGDLGCADLSALGAAFGVLDLAAGSDPTATTTGDTLTLTCSGVTCAGGAKSLALSVASDAAAGTASLRTLGTGATQAAAGNDARLSDSRAPTAHAASHASGGGDALAGTLAVSVTGSAASATTATTAAGLAANPENCSSGAAAGIGADGAAEGCVAYLPIAGGTLTGSVTGPWFDGSFVRGMAGATPKAALNRGTEPGGRSVGVAIAQDRDLCWSSSASADDGFDTCLYRSAANVLELTDGNTGSSRLQVRGIRLVPRSSPVSACDASTRGLSYYDSDDGDFCDCVASGYRSRGGAGTCN